MITPPDAMACYVVAYPIGAAMWLCFIILKVISLSTSHVIIISCHLLRQSV